MNNIYRIYNMFTEKSYIGSTTRDIYTRFHEHLRKSVKKVDGKFYNALRNENPLIFNIELLEEVTTTDELSQREIHYIEAYDALRNGYNSDRGGGFRKTIYQFEKGNSEPIATFSSLKEAGDAVGASEKSISNACLGYNKSCRGFLWGYSNSYPLDVDTRPKVVYQYSLEGELINTFSSAREASKILGFGLPSITRCCRGERKQTSGFKFSY